MMIPPIVGVPAFAWCSCGPSSRICWPNSRARRNAMNFGDRKMQMSSEAVPAIRTSPMQPAPCERLGDDLEPDAARALDQHDVARADELAGAARPPRRRRRPRATRRRTCRASRPTRGPTVTSRSTPADGRVARRSRGGARASAGAELEHVAEHRDAPAGGLVRGEIVEGGAHGQRVGVVAVVDDGGAARRARRARRAARRSATSTRPARRARRPPARRPPRPAC